VYIDSRKLKPNQIVDIDICVIGAGAAGITLALELSNKPFRVCLLESGGFSSDAETESLNDAINIGRNYSLQDTRARYFGGTTNLWGGHCVPIRPMNFESRDWIPYSGWPFKRNALDVYYKRAHEVHRIGEFQYDASAIANSLDMELFPFDRTKVQSVVSRYNAMSFGLEYRDTLDRALNIVTYLYANVTSINRNPDRDHIRDVSVKTLAGNSFSVRAKYYVLAAGGIENARLLLLSNEVQKSGLGNQHDLVGRFFMEHLWFPSGFILPSMQDSSLEIYGREHPYGNRCNIRCHIALPENVIRENNIPEYRSEIGVTREPPASVVSAREIRDKIKNNEFPDKLSQCLVNIMSDPGPVIRYLNGKKDKLLMYRLKNYVETVPNPNSRIGLSNEKDKLGLNKATLDWRLSKIDKAGIRTAQRFIAAEVGRTNFGRMWIELAHDEDVLLEGADGGSHHMGTTRMNDNPRKGVVDSNCRIHGLENIFVAGSSVFPNCGYSNPTLTIVALAIRLADHLTNKVAKEGLS
jgi:choline dehydrogenase-like flavoprotein